MMARRTFGRGVFGLLAGSAAALVAGCKPSKPANSTYRFRMTVEVETPEGIKRGSGVLEAQGRRTNNLDTGGQGSWAKLEGEAVAVDVAPGKTLFALLQLANGTSSDDNLAVASMRAMDPAYNYNKKESAQRIASGDGIVSPATVRAEDYPLLVTFGDVRDPKTVARVAPDNLAATFGPGVSLKRITIAVTDDPVTTGIEKRLGWLPQYYDKQFSGARFQNAEDLRVNGLAAVMSAGEFSANMGLSKYDR